MFLFFFNVKVSGATVKLTFRRNLTFCQHDTQSQSSFPFFLCSLLDHKPKICCCFFVWFPLSGTVKLMMMMFMIEKKKLKHMLFQFFIATLADWFYETCVLIVWLIARSHWAVIEHFHFMRLKHIHGRTWWWSAERTAKNKVTGIFGIYVHSSAKNSVKQALQISMCQLQWSGNMLCRRSWWRGDDEGEM